MLKIFEKLHLKPDFPIVEAEASRVSSRNKIVKVDFNKTPKVYEDGTAWMCVIVAASNGQRGTLSHITVDKDAQKYITELRSQWGNEKAAIILVGGEDSVQKSVDMMEDLRRGLRESGFKISGLSLGGSLKERNVCMTPDTVIMQEADFSQKHKEEVSINF